MKYVFIIKQFMCFVNTHKGKSGKEDAYFSLDKKRVMAYTVNIPFHGSEKADLTYET